RVVLVPRQHRDGSLNNVGGPRRDPALAPGVLAGRRLDLPPIMIQLPDLMEQLPLRRGKKERTGVLAATVEEHHVRALAPENEVVAYPDVPYSGVVVLRVPQRECRAGAEERVVGDQQMLGPLAGVAQQNAVGVG